MSSRNRHSGFTLIELIVVIVILGILGAVALPKFVNLGGDARASVIKGLAGSLEAANSLVYAKAALAGQLGATGTVTVNGASISTVYGYAADLTATNLTNPAVFALTPLADFTVAATTIQHATATTPASCVATYTVATATAPARVVPTVTGC